MAYSVESAPWNDLFVVPGAVVDNLRLCGAPSLKAILILLRRGGCAEAAELAEALNLSLVDVQDAMNYWVQLGVVRSDERAAGQALTWTAEPPAPPAAPAPEPPDEPEPTARPGASRKRLSTKEINEMSRSDKTVEFLLQEAQSVIGGTLTPVVTDTVISLYSYYGMKPEVLLMLLQYCVSIGKDNMRYVEKVAASWLERGIDTHEKAEDEIQRTAERDSTEGRVKSLFGIDRNLTSNEKQFIRSWTEELCFSMDLIQMAYERGVEIKGKLSFPYINGILANWHKAGVTTTREAAQEIAGNKGRQKQPVAAPSKASYDMNEIEKLITYGELGH